MIRIVVTLFFLVALVSSANAQQPRRTPAQANPQAYAADQSAAAQLQQQVAATNSAINNTKIVTAPQGRAN